MKKQHKVELGQWMETEAVLRLPQPYDRKYPPKFSHVATIPPKFKDVTELIPCWEQRFLNKVYQVPIVFDLK